ncbi:hypothetical protein IFM89_012823 [Coptis chinensis]|uniref:C3H1-type domain-containing protein n=1 Tax=Coptis chinensis TaxID=261450 RepID=A0A835H5P3_9MAGN|nr:hypothetical protein IFM89_012823 [Coptis chinensis]
MEPQRKRFRSENGGSWSNPNQFGSGSGVVPECKRFKSVEGCPFGSNCRYRHVSADGRDSLPHSLSSGGKPKPCMKFFSVFVFQVWLCFRDSSFTLTSAYDDLEVKICCVKGLSTSGCPYGESCHFLHYIPGGLSSLGLAPIVSLSAAPSITSRRKPVASIGDPSATISGFKTKLCNRFNTAEGCPFGDKCHFAHGESDLQLPKNQSQGNIRRGQAQGRRTSAPGYSNEGSDYSNTGTFENTANFTSEGYGQGIPSGATISDGSASNVSGSMGENLQVY